MAHILHGYVITVKERRGEPQLLGNLDGSGTRLIDEMAEFLVLYQKKHWRDEDDAESALRVRAVYPNDADLPDVLAAEVEAGQGGRTSEFVDLTEEGLGEEVAFRRKKHHAELVKVLVLAKLPELRTQGFLIVHSPHGYGIKTRFWGTFATWFRSRHSDLTLQIERTVPGGAANALLDQGALRKVTLVKHVRQSDLADEERRYFREDALGTVRTVIAAPRAGWLIKTPIEKVLSGEAQIGTLLTFRGEEYNEVSVEVEFADRKHTIHLAERRVPRGGEDVTDKVHYDSDGRPTYDSLRHAALEYVELLAGRAF